MNYIALFSIILAGLVFMFLAGYSIAHKRMAGHVARLKEQLASALIVSNYSENSQQVSQPVTRPAPVPAAQPTVQAARNYNPPVAVAPEQPANNRRRGRA